MNYKLTRYEMETVINYNAEEKTVSMSTRDRAVIRRLDRLVEEFPDVYQCLSRTEIDAVYRFPKKLLSFRKPRTYTEEQLAAIRERFARTKAVRLMQPEEDDPDEEEEEDGV